MPQYVHGDFWEMALLEAWHAEEHEKIILVSDNDGISA